MKIVFHLGLSLEEINIQGDEATVSGLEANLYVEPVVDQEVFKIGVINEGTTLTVLETIEGWAKVITPDHFLGWVRTTDIIELKR